MMILLGIILILLIVILLTIRLERWLENDPVIKEYYANKTYDEPINLKPSMWGGHGIDSSGQYWQVPPGYRFKDR